MVMPVDMLSLYTPPDQTEIEVMLDRSIDRLHSNHCSAVLFALQNLHSMTTQDSYNSSTTNMMCKYIMENYNNVRDCIAFIFISRIGGMRDDETSEQICDLSL